MLPEAKVIEIYYMADYFYKEFAKGRKKYKLEDKIHNHRNKQNRTGYTEIMAILIQFGRFQMF